MREWNADIAGISTMRDCIAKLCGEIFSGNAITQEKQYHIKLALNEMISNAFIHTGGEHVSVCVHLDNSGRIELCVHSEKVDKRHYEALLAALGEANSPADVMRETGRGLRIVHSIAKELRVEDEGKSLVACMDIF